MQLSSVLPFGALLLAGAALAIVSPQESGPKNVIEAARAFLDKLPAEKKAKVQFAFNSEERFNWHFIPRERKGICFKDYDDEQKDAAITLLKMSLSQKGFAKAETIRQLENVLLEIEKGSGPLRDPENYFLSIFGTPSDKGQWGWRYEGHHLSLQWTMINGKVISSTPQFFGTNPGEVRSGPMKGTRVLAAEEDLARKLLKSLTPDQTKVCVISSTAPSDILTSAQRTAAIQEDKGIAYTALDKAQQQTLMALIQEHASAQPRGIAKARLDALTKAGLDTIKFAWMGQPDRGQPHYYRVQGKTFLIEYDNTQNNANHVHAVWRDFRGDFGVDLIAAHYKAHSHMAGAPHVGPASTEE